jgi:oxalate decarboxylase
MKNFNTDETGTTRRSFLGASTMAAATAALGTAAATAQTPQGVRQGERDRSSSDPGPENNAIRQQQPDAFLPPPTDHGNPQTFWSSFSLMHRRIQEGGWARQVNVHDFPISKDIAGVNMFLEAGAFRELHWHVSDEWSIVLSGSCRLTALDYDGKPWVQDVKQGDLWYFPAGIPHSLQGLGPNGCEFLLVFDDGSFSEEDTSLISDWVKHTPPEVLSKNWGVPATAFSSAIAQIPPNGKYFFKTPIPPPLAQDRAAASRFTPLTTRDFSFRPSEMQPQKSTKSGNVRIVDSSNFKVAQNIAMAYVTIHPGGMRELHWHPNANEWQYWIAGKGRMTVFFNASTARTQDFNPGDVGYIPKTLPHYIENTGDTDLIFLEMFNTDRYRDFSLNDWMTHMPPEAITQTLNISREVLDAIPRDNYAILPH